MLFIYGKLWLSPSQIKGQLTTDEALNDSLNEVSIFHPEHAFAAAVSHEFVTQVLRPVGPLVRPRAVPGEAAPGVPQSQQPETQNPPSFTRFTALSCFYCSVTMSARVTYNNKTSHSLCYCIISENWYGLLFCSLLDSTNHFLYMQSGVLKWLVSYCVSYGWTNPF